MRIQGESALGTAAKVVSLISLIVAAFMAICIVLILVAPGIDRFPIGFAFDAGEFMAGPFDGLFPTRSVKSYVLANWGLAAVVWLLLGQVVALLLRRIDGMTTASTG